MGEDEWVRVTAGKVGDQIVAAPLSRGAGVITSLVRADGIVRIPRFSEGVNTGDPVAIELYTDPAEIDRTIVHIGSHDLTLDLLAQYLAELGNDPDPAKPDRATQRRFVSAHAGSLGGLIALRRGERHMWLDRICLMPPRANKLLVHQTVFAQCARCVSDAPAARTRLDRCEGQSKEHRIVGRPCAIGRAFRQSTARRGHACAAGLSLG